MCIHELNVDEQEYTDLHTYTHTHTYIDLILSINTYLYI